MPFWKTFDFECNLCGKEFEDLVSVREDGSYETECPLCGSSDVTKLLSAPALSSFSMKSPSDRAASLRERSRSHSIKEISRNPEKWGKAGFDAIKRSKKHE